MYVTHACIACWSCHVTVGGGTAGSVLARRLSDDEPHRRVLVLEAGGDDTTRHIADIPLAARELQRLDVDWSYKIQPQTNACLSFDNNVSTASGNRGCLHCILCSLVTVIVV